jgi:enoyl-CoA hydratase
MAEPAVLLARRGSAALITLNRPRALNALTLAMVRELRAAVAPGAAPAGAPAPSCVLLRGAGAGGGRVAFCAGGDVRTIHDQRSAPRAQLDFFREEYLADFALARHAAAAAPHVALWDGVVMGGGVGVSIHAPFRVATENTLFAMPETALGILPDVGGSHVLPRLALGPWWGLYLGLTGARLAGADAVHGGLATHFVPAARLGALEAALEALPAGGAYAARAAGVAAALAAHATPAPALPPFSHCPATLAALARAFAPAGASVPALHARLRSEAAAAAPASLLRSALAALGAASPTACAVALEAQRRGGAPGGTLGAALAMELRALARLLGEGGPGDFYEGVRAVLVDKGKGAPPAWAPVGEGGLTAPQLAAYFEGGGAVEGEEELRALGSHTAALG